MTGGGCVRPEHVQALACTRRVVQEAMWLYPPAPLITRLATTEVRLGDLVVPTGTPTYVPVYAVHRHRRLWDDADAFEPDRFLPEAARARHRYADMPPGAMPAPRLRITLRPREGMAMSVSARAG